MLLLYNTPQLSPINQSINYFIIWPLCDTSTHFNWKMGDPVKYDLWLWLVRGSVIGGTDSCDVTSDVLWISGGQCANLGVNGEAGVLM